MNGPGQILAPLPREISRRLVGSIGVLLLATAIAATVVTAPQLLTPATEGVRDAGPVSDLAAPGVRGLRVLAAVVTVGALEVALLVGGSDRATALKVAASRWALAWAGAAGCSVLVEISQTSGVPIGDVLSGGGSAIASADQVLGLTVTAWLAAVVSFLARRVDTSRGVALALLLAASALVAPVLTGHSAHAGFSATALTALALHVMAVSFWVGGLLALCAHADATTRLDAAVLRRFSLVALICYVVVALSGVANLLARLSLLDLVRDGGTYFVLLLLKLSLFVVLGAMGLTHRRRTLGRAESGASPSFWSLAVTEAAVMAAALGLAVSLAATAPAEGTDDVHAAAPDHFTSA
jgi:putative copper resistance protein D